MEARTTTPLRHKPAPSCPSGRLARPCPRAAPGHPAGISRKQAEHMQGVSATGCSWEAGDDSRSFPYTLRAESPGFTGCPRWPGPFPLTTAAQAELRLGSEAGSPGPGPAVTEGGPTAVSM